MAFIAEQFQTNPDTEFVTYIRSIFKQLEDQRNKDTEYQIELRLLSREITTLLQQQKEVEFFSTFKVNNWYKTKPNGTRKERFIHVQKMTDKTITLAEHITVSQMYALGQKRYPLNEGLEVIKRLELVDISEVPA